MEVKNPYLVISAPDSKSWPDSVLPEIVMAGRSNVGKSSLINTITRRKNLAYVGNTPGKTRLLNFFNIDDRFMLVDVPGYGYANASKKMLIQFGEMMEDYFEQRKQKKGLLIIVDARHKPSEDDITMIEYARYHHMRLAVIATKMDKLKRSEIQKCLDKIKTTLQLSEEEPLIPFSSEKKQGIDRVWQVIDDMLEDR
ncbi:ribosome biogenesis GTP-binding protein YihA/YsxC [uncultured Traorella sp.]|uniref:ribosome biogenesis GTP-binding protein YihA/YsxC n=1 Tax=uncultured Traorella sp. TaxID=1929048 RepID=UPI0025F29E6E|nr:ribosome biogenesis GTP-binding protein YihA/YsxC [uncultured Traorella sp.]